MSNVVLVLAFSIFLLLILAGFSGP